LRDVLGAVYVPCRNGEDDGRFAARTIGTGKAVAR
jgi:hypothetical protein